MLFERVNASGTGLVIGSIGDTHVRNITFRDSRLHWSFKGIFLKFRAGKADAPGLIEDITYENIIVEGAQQWPIWIGPAQQAVSSNPCYANPCSLCWPVLPDGTFGTTCEGVQHNVFRNILFKDITLTHTVGSPGVILGSPDYPIDGITFDSVRVTSCGERQDMARTQRIRKESFPGLRQPIDDPFVVYFYLIIAGIVVACVLVPSVLCCTLRRRRSGSIAQGDCHGAEPCCCCPLPPPPHPLCCPLKPPPCALTCRKCCLHRVDPGKARSAEEFWTLPKFLGVFAALAAGVFGPLIWMMPGYSDSKVLDEYYACEGVSNAVAIGHTWPVPRCFEDRTTKGDLGDIDKHCLSPNPTIVGIWCGAVFGVLAVMGGIAGLWRILRKRALIAAEQTPKELGEHELVRLFNPEAARTPVTQDVVETEILTTLAPKKRFGSDLKL